MAKRLAKKAKTNFKICDIRIWEANILPNTSRSKIGQLIELQEDIFFFKKHAEHVAGTPAPELFLFF